MSTTGAKDMLDYFTGYDYKVLWHKIVKRSVELGLSESLLEPGFQSRLFRRMRPLALLSVLLSPLYLLIDVQAFIGFAGGASIFLAWETRFNRKLREKVRLMDELLRKRALFKKYEEKIFLRAIGSPPYFYVSQPVQREKFLYLACLDAHLEFHFYRIDCDPRSKPLTKKKERDFWLSKEHIPVDERYRLEPIKDLPEDYEQHTSLFVASNDYGIIENIAGHFSNKMLL